MMVSDHVYLPNKPKEKRPIEPIDYVFRFIIGALFGALIGWLPAYRVYPITYGNIDRILIYATIFGISVIIIEEYFWRILEFLARFLTRGGCWNPKS